MKLIIRDFFSFLTGKSNLAESKNRTILWLVVGYSLLLIAVLIHSLIKSILLKLNLITLVDGAGSPDKWIAETSLLVFAIQVGILAPLYEEFAFRGILVKNKIVVAFSLVIFIFLMTCKITDTRFYSVSLKSILIFTTTFFVVLIFYNKIVPLVKLFASKNLKWLIYLSAAGFAIWHYNNFDFSNATNFTILFTLSRYFFQGLVFCWISNRKDLNHSILLHIIYNGLPVLIAFVKY